MKAKVENRNQKAETGSQTSALCPLPSGSEAGFSPEQIDQLRLALRAELAAPAITDRILTLAEAIPYTKHESASAFYRWCKRWRVTSATYGRFARGQLDSALAREAEKRRQSRAGRCRSAA